MSYKCPSCKQIMISNVSCNDGGTKFCSLCNFPFHIDEKNNIHKGYISKCSCYQFIFNHKIDANYKKIKCPHCNDISDFNIKLNYLHCMKCDNVFLKSYFIKLS